MATSPGIEFVWALAAREALFARSEFIEPEHFFCALLKFSEMRDSQLEEVAASATVARALLPQRDRIQELLKARGWPTQKLRHRLRRELGRGTHEHSGDMVHRSPASRSLFQDAQSAARRQGNSLEPEYLLEILAEHPTEALDHVLNAVVGKADERASQPAAKAESPAAPFGEHVQPLASDEELPASCAPQVRVIGESLEKIANRPLVLACEEESPLPALLLAAQDKESATPQIFAVDFEALSPAGEAEQARADKLAALLEQVREQPAATALLFDFQTADMAQLEAWLAVFKPVLESDSVPPLIIAASVAGYERGIAVDPSLDHACRSIWLHQLADLEIPATL